MALRVGLGDYFYGLNYDYGNSLCITDDSIILATINDPATKMYDGYVVIQRETGTVAAEFRNSRLTNGRPSISAVKAVTISGEIAAAGGGTATVTVNGNSVTTTSFPKGASAEAVANDLYAKIIADGSIVEDVTVVQDSSDPRVLLFTAKVSGVDFTLDAATTDTPTTRSIAATTLTAQAFPTPVTRTSAPVPVDTNRLKVNEATGFTLGQKIIIDPQGAAIERVIQAIDTVNNLIDVTVSFPAGVLIDTEVRGVTSLKLASLQGIQPGMDVTLGGDEPEVVRIKNVDLLKSEATTETSLVYVHVAGSEVDSLETEVTSQNVQVLSLVENQTEVPASTPETDVICFDYSSSLSKIFCFRKGSKQLLQLDAYNATTRPIGIAGFTSIVGNILDMHVTNNVAYILDDQNLVYKYNLETGLLLDKISIHPQYRVLSVTGAHHTLHDRFTHEDPTGQDKLNINRLYLLLEDNKVLIYDLDLRRIIQQTTITSDVPVKGIDFYRTYQISPADETILKDYSGTTETELYDVGFLFSLASGLSNGEVVNRWQYNLFKYVPTTIMMVSGNAVIVPSNTITVYARGLSDQGEVINDLPIKFTVAGNAGGTIVKPANGTFNFPPKRDGWVTAMYQAADSPPIGSSDTITSIIIT